MRTSTKLVSAILFAIVLIVAGSIDSPNSATANESVDSTTEIGVPESVEQNPVTLMTGYDRYLSEPLLDHSATMNA